MDAGRVVDTWERVVWASTPVAQAAVLATIVLRGIVRDFRVFVIYLLADMLVAATLWWLGRSPDTEAYREVWVTTKPLLLIFQILVVLEFYRLLYRAYPGIQAFARVLILVAIGVALAVTFGTVQLDVHRIVWRFPDVQRLFVVTRVVSSLLGFLMFTTMAFFPKAPSARNLLLHGWLLALLFIAAAGGFFGINVGLATAWMGALFMTVQLCCFAIWAVALRSPYVKAKPSAEAMARTERWNKDLMVFARWLIR